MWICVSVLYRVTVRHAVHVAVGIGDAFHLTDDLDDAVELVHAVGVQLKQLVGQRVGLAEVIAVAVDERVRYCVGLLHGVAVRHALPVAVRVGHALNVVDDLDDALELVHRVALRHAISLAVSVGHALPIADDFIDCFKLGDLVSDDF